MSRVPSQDVWLAPDFDPWTLKVAQLRSILLEHSIVLPSAAKKPDLINAFVNDILPKRDALLKAAAMAKGKSSSAGILHVRAPGQGEPALVLSGRRKSQASIAVAEEAAQGADGKEESEPDQPVKARRSTRRSSVLPSSSSTEASPSVSARTKPIRRTKSKTTIQDVQVAEESEPESEQDIVVVENKPKSRKSKAGESQTGPSSKVPEAEAKLKKKAVIKVDEESGFSDHNPFQSGGETPDPKEKKLRRKSSLGNASQSLVSKAARRQSELPPSAFSRGSGGDIPSSFSNPHLGGFRSPETSPASTRAELEQDVNPVVNKSNITGPRKSFPASLTAARFMPDRESLQTPPRAWKEAHSSGRENEIDLGATTSGQEDEGEPKVVAQEDMSRSPEDPNAPYVKHNEVVAKKLSFYKTGDSPPSSSSTKALIRSKRPSSSLALATRPKAGTGNSTLVVKSATTILPSLAALLSLLLYLIQWKDRSASIGYCDPNSNTNSILLSRQRAAIECAQARENHDGSDNEVVLTACHADDLPFIPFVPMPSTCTPCPAHAVCVSVKFVGCEREYIVRPPFAAGLLGDTEPFNGLPGLGPVAFPPSCVPDSEKKTLMLSMARAIEGELAKSRGESVCKRGHPKDAVAEVFAVEEDELRNSFLERKDPSFSSEQFMDIWDLAVEDLLKHHDIAVGKTSDGFQWLAALRGDIPLACRAKLEAKDRLNLWKGELSGVAAILAAILYGRNQLQAKTAEKRQVEALVQVALSKLRDQEQRHYLDPVQAPDPFIPSAHLRDLVLANIASPSSRQRLWTKVESIVEGNANVRAKEAELKGEVWRVWEWVGAVLPVE